MQKTLRDMLAQRRHLADLGLAVSKINHDLRNILASAQLFSDRMGSVEDPLVKRFAPKVIGAIDRAIELHALGARLRPGDGGAAAPPAPVAVAPRRRRRRRAGAARPRARAVGEPRRRRRSRSTATPSSSSACSMNLCRNALEAVGDGDDPAVIRRVWVEGERQGSVDAICASATPAPACRRRARANLFQPFQGSVAARRHRPRPRHRGGDRARPWRRHPPRRPAGRRRGLRGHHPRPPGQPRRPPPAPPRLKRSVRTATPPRLLQCAAASD